MAEKLEDDLVVKPQQLIGGINGKKLRLFSTSTVSQYRIEAWRISLFPEYRSRGTNNFDTKENATPRYDTVGMEKSLYTFVLACIVSPHSIQVFILSPVEFSTTFYDKRATYRHTGGKNQGVARKFAGPLVNQPDQKKYSIFKKYSKNIFRNIHKNILKTLHICSCFHFFHEFNA